jgi:Fe-S oxidoreductase
MRDSSVCCGFGGSFAVDYPRVSTAILGKKLDNAAVTAADIIVSDNPGCLIQLRGGLIASGSHTRALHVAELICERMPD